MLIYKLILTTITNVSGGSRKGTVIKQKVTLQKPKIIIIELNLLLRMR